MIFRRKFLSSSVSAQVIALSLGRAQDEGSGRFFTESTALGASGVCTSVGISLTAGRSLGGVYRSG